jgi:hypothetical protein
MTLTLRRLVIGKLTVGNLAGISTIVTIDFRRFIRSLQINYGIVSRVFHDHFLLNPFPRINYPTI